MSTEIKKRIGTVPCPLCGTICAVKVNQRNTLNYVCHTGCDNPGWAKAGTRAHEIISERMTRLEPLPKQQAAPAPVLKQQAAPAPAPAPVVKKMGFFA